jgi:hypothetical protein
MTKVCLETLFVLLCRLAITDAKRLEQPLLSCKADGGVSTLEPTATIAVRNCGRIQKKFLGALPSEDKRNQQITSAEIFAGMCGGEGVSFQLE